MNDMFEGFWEATTNGAVPNPLLQGRSVEAQGEKQAPQDQIIRDDPKMKEQYRRYVSGVENYPKLAERIQSKEQECARLEDNLPSAERDAAAKQRELEKRNNELQQQLAAAEERRNNEITVLRNQQTSSSSVTGFKKPQPDEEVCSIIQNAMEHRLMTGAQIAYIEQDVQMMCGDEGAVRDVRDLEKWEKTFVNSKYCDNLKTGLPSDEHVSKWLRKIATYASIVMFVLLLLGGLKLGFISSIISAIVYLIVLVIAGGVISVLGTAILQGIFKDHPTLSTIGGIIVGFFVFGTSIASSVSGWLSSQITNGSFFVGLIAGAVVAGINWIAVYCLVSWLPVVKWMKKMPAFRDKMMRGVFQEMDHIENMNTILYCFANHEMMCQFFEEEEILSNINQLKSMIAKSDKNITDINYKLNALKQEASQLYLQARSTKSRLQTEVDRKRSELNQLYNDMSWCVQSINSWHEQPALDWIGKYNIQNVICISNLQDQSKFSLCNLNMDGLTVHYSIDEDNLRNESDIGIVAKAVIDAFSKMNPSELMEISVISMKIWLEKYSSIKWRTEKQSASGGTGRNQKGIIYRVSTNKELKEEFIKRLIERRNERDDLEDKYEADLESIRRKDRSDIKELRHLNQIRQENGEAPLPYQIVIMYMDSVIYTERDLADLIRREVSGQGCIPVFLINDLYSYKSGERENASWDRLIRRAEASHISI